MRRFICIIIACSIFCYAFITETEFSNKEIFQLEGIDAKYTDTFFIPNNDSIINPDGLYKALLETSSNTNSNIIRTLFTEKESGYEVEKYVMLSGASDYMSAFEVKSGRTLTVDESRSKKNIFVSTYKKESKNQIGQIRSEMKRMNLTIYPLYAQFLSYKADGVYMVELGKDVSLQNFLEYLAKSINEYCETDIDFTCLQAEESNTIRLPYVDTFMLYLLQIALGIILVLMFLYNTFYETKKISIFKLLGKENMVIFWNFQKSFLYITLLSILISAMYSFIRYENLEYMIIFLYRVSIFALIQFGVISGILLIIMCRSSILKGLKGGYSTKYIYYLNIFTKILCICVVIYSGKTVYNTLKESTLMKEKMKSWEIANDYGVFYPYYIGFDMSDNEEKNCEITIGQDLYCYLNDRGALYVDATPFEQEFHKLNKETAPWQFDVSVNPNYLKIFPIYDTDGKRIEIEEQEKDLILLVPEKYLSYKDAIIENYKNMQLDKIDRSRNYYGINCDDLAKQKIDIIWVQDDQGIFGFSTRVFANEEGYIINTITRVVTEKNSTVLDRIGILGKGDLDPLKVFMGNNVKSGEVYKNISPMLRELNLDDNLKNLVSINENINERILELKAQRHIALMMAGIGLLLLTVLIIQSISLDFHRNRQRYIIQKIHGVPGLRIYRKYIFLSAFVYILIGSIFVLIDNSNPLYYLCMTIVLTVLQYMISIVAIMKLERKHISDVLKGA